MTIYNGEIEQSVPVPPPVKKKEMPLHAKYAFGTLEVGESCVIHVEGQKAMHNLRAAISSLAKHQDRTFTTRSVAIRVWRLT
jgi:hypothetical protein